MTLELADYPVTLWLVDGVPIRMPEHPWVIPLEPVTPLVGWRFQATDDAGAVQVFDVVRQDDGGWTVLRAWT